MALWGNSTTDESKPKWLSTEEKANTFATPKGWVYKQPSGTEEILCAIGTLSTSLGNATINAVNFLTTSYGGTGAIQVEVVYNEKVTISGDPYILIANDQAGGGSLANLQAYYDSGSGTNRIVFEYAGGVGTVAVDDVLSIAAQSIALNSGSIVDTGTSTASAVAISAPIAAAAGTITVA
jgi:hypothetical protein